MSIDFSDVTRVVGWSYRWVCPSDSVRSAIVFAELGHLLGGGAVLQHLICIKPDVLMNIFRSVFFYQNTH